MKILSLLKSKTNAAASGSTPSTSGSVRVIGGDNTTVDGQTINPAIVNAGIVNASEINSNNINNTNNITTNTLNANYVTADTLRATTLSSQLINAGTINATEHSTFQDGITAYHDSTLQDIISENIENSGLITTKDLEVTGSAHFFELIIDKIKAAGGSVLITPADGFTIDDATLETMNVRAASYSYLPVTQVCPVLWFRAEDGDRTITNMWQPYDQAICANFNEVKEGRSTDVSNNYWWWMVGATDNDNLGGDVDTITSYTYTYYPVNDYTSYSYTSSATTGYGGAIMHPIYNKHGEYIDTVPCHYIALVAQCVDQQTGDMDIKDSSSANLLDINVLKKQIGNDVAMLGHNWRDTRTILDTTNRRSAIYMSCYTNWLDNGLRPPLFAHYRGINNFGPLSSKRSTKFDAIGGEIIGTFKVQAAGTSTTTDLDDYILGTVGQTEYELSCTANNNNSQLEIIVLQADENSNIHDMNNFPTLLKIGVMHNGSFVAANKYSSLEVAVFGVTYDLLNFTQPIGSGILPTSVTWNSTSHTYDMAFAYSGTGYMQVANSSIEISCTISDGGETYNVYKGIQMPVITSIEGTDADLYMLNPVEESVIIDKNGLLTASLTYRLKRCVGTTVTYETTTQGHTCKVYIYSEAKIYMTEQTMTFNNNAWSFTDSQSDWYGTVPPGKTPADRKYIYKVELINSSNVVVDNRDIMAVNEPAALFSVEEGLTTSIQGNTTAIQNAQGDITTLQTDYSSITQTVNGIQTTVVSHTTEISNINGDITNINTSMSTIDQKADHISAYVEYVDGTTTGTLPGKLKTTGIDIGQGTITLNADNTVINGSLDIYDDNCGLTLYNSDGQIKTQIVTRNVSSINNNNFIHVCTASGIISNDTVTLIYNLGLINTGTNISIGQQSIEVTDGNTTTSHPAGDYTVSIIDENDNVLVTNSITNAQIENGGCDIANYTFNGSNQQLRLKLDATLGSRDNLKLTWQFTETVTADAYNIIGRDGMLITNTKNRMFRIDNNEMTIQSNDDAMSFIPRVSGDTQTPMLRRGWNGNNEFWMPFDNYGRTIRLIDYNSTTTNYNDRTFDSNRTYAITYNEAGTYVVDAGHSQSATTNFYIDLPASGSFMGVPGYTIKIVHGAWSSTSAKHDVYIRTTSGDQIVHGTSKDTSFRTNDFGVYNIVWTGTVWAAS